MNGLEVLARIRQKGLTVPVIMVTGQGDERIAVEAMKQEAADYIVKTVNYQDALPASVTKVIEKSQLKKKLAEASLRAKKLYEIALSVATERKAEAMADILVNGARSLTGAAAALFFLVAPDGSGTGLMRSVGIEIDPELFRGPIESLGIFALTYAEQRSVLVEAPDRHPLWPKTPEHRPRMEQCLSVPLIHQGKIGGVLTVMNKEGKTAFVPEDLDSLSTLAVHTAIAIENARFLEEAERLAVTDSLTGLYNHREFQKRLMEELERAQRYGSEFSLLMMDIDHFKEFNDVHGHPVGDAILKEVVKTLRDSIRNVDILSRYGGEEFTLIMPETDGKNGKIVAERIRYAVAEKEFLTRTQHSVHVTISIGVASFPLDAAKREELIVASDEALYFAKNEGRNKVCRYSETLKSAIEKDPAKLTSLLQDPKMKTLRDLATTIDAKSPYTRGHTEAVLEHAVRLAEVMNLREEEKKHLQIASLLHNIGMVSIPDAILNKVGPLSGEERMIIQAHPGLAQMLIKGVNHLESIIPAILYHHERYDGTGYPNKLKGDQIPLLARMLGVVEAYAAMTSVRPYRPRMSHAEALAELRRTAGSQFDPQIVEAFIKSLQTEHHSSA